MDKQIEISSIKITIGKKEIDLSPEDAKKLHQALNDMFGEKKTEVVHHYDYYRYWPIYSTPTYPKYDWGTVYCTTAKGNDASLAVNIS